MIASRHPAGDLQIDDAVAHAIAALSFAQDGRQRRPAHGRRHAYRCKRSLEARDALSDYQTATAANDLFGARKALLKLVRAKDDVPDYWVELGKVQVAMGMPTEPYAFSPITFLYVVRAISGK